MNKSDFDMEREFVWTVVNFSHCFQCVSFCFRRYFVCAETESKNHFVAKGSRINPKFWVVLLYIFLFCN